MAYYDQAKMLSKAPNMVGLLGGSVASGLAKEVDPSPLSYPGSGVLTNPFITQLVVCNDSFVHPNMVRQVNIYWPFPVVVTGCSGKIQDPYTTLSSLIERIETESIMGSELPVKRKLA